MLRVWPVDFNCGTGIYIIHPFHLHGEAPLHLGSLRMPTESGMEPDDSPTT